VRDLLTTLGIIIADRSLYRIKFDKVNYSHPVRLNATMAQ